MTSATLESQELGMELKQESPSHKANAPRRNVQKLATNTACKDDIQKSRNTK